MVGRLAYLKWRLLVNGLKADRQRLLGLLFIVLVLPPLVFTVVTSYAAGLGALPPLASGELSLWVMAIAWFGWVVLPVIFFPVDEPLDPSRFALLPIPRAKLMAGLAAAGFITPTIAIPLGLFGVNIARFGLGFQLPIVVAAQILLLLLFIVTGQTFTVAVSLVFRSRRGRDLAVFIVTLIALAIFVGQQVITQVIDDLGIVGALETYGLSPFAAAIPPAAAQLAAVAAWSGNIGQAVFGLAAAAAWIIVLTWAWQRLIDRSVTTPEVSTGSRRLRGKGLITSSPTGWMIPAVAGRKELRLYARDPRLRAVWTGSVIFLAVFAASGLIGSATLGGLRRFPQAVLMTPVFVLFIGLPVTLNQLGWERNAATFLFALPALPRQLLEGKNLAVGLMLMGEALVLGVVLAWMTGGWEFLLPMIPLTFAAVLCQLAVGNLVSVLAPLRLPRPGTDIFGQAAEAGCLAFFAQMVGFFVIGLLLVPPAVSVVLGEMDVLPRALALVWSVGWGAVVYSFTLRIASRSLGRRIPEVVAAVQTD